MRTLLLLATCLLALAVAGAQPAGAIVPPKDCGMTTVKSKRYNIKSDQLRCRRARRYARTYLRTGRRPSGYRCRKYSNTALKFRCTRGSKVFFAIRR